MDLRGRNFLKLLDYTPEEIRYLLDLAAELKEKKKKGIPVDTLHGSGNLALAEVKTGPGHFYDIGGHRIGTCNKGFVIHIPMSSAVP